MAAFKDMKTSQEIKQYLLNVLSRTGGKDKKTACLYHYTKIKSLQAMLSSGYIWLGSTDQMNDYLEHEFVDSVKRENKLFFSCFSRVEENLAMYKMYAPSPDGAMMAIPFTMAEAIIDNLETSNGKKLVRIVRDNKLTDEKIEADVYWAAVAYKDLHSSMLKSDTVVNTHISRPKNDPELVGFVKLYGWEYEKEVRLCAVTDRALGKNEKIAVELPSDIDRHISIITGPGFNRTGNLQLISELTRCDFDIKASEYDNLVNLGSTEPENDKTKDERELYTLRNYFDQKKQIIIKNGVYDDYINREYEIVPDSCMNSFFIKSSWTFKLVDLHNPNARYYFSLNLPEDNDFKILTFNVNNEEMKDQIHIIGEEDFEHHRIRKKFEMQLPLREDHAAVVIFRFSYKEALPVLYLHSSYMYPAKKRAIIINIDGKESKDWIVNASAFSAFRNIRSMQPPFKIRKDEVGISETLKNQRYSLVAEEWTLPGFGYAFAVTKKEHTAACWRHKEEKLGD